MLELFDLTKTFPGPVTALQGVHLEIPKGMFGLLGPNGSGKTTMMRIIAGLLEPTSGKVEFDGENVTVNPKALWPKLGYLPQHFGFYPNHTGRAALMHLLRLKGVHGTGSLGALADELLVRVNLAEAAGRRVKGYSGGMRQRLGIAQAIAGNPQLIIVDEPTAGLDPEERMRFYRLLGELAEQRTVLLSTHIVDDVAVLCPRFAVIRKGRLLATTTPAAARSGIEGRIFEGEATPDQFEQLSKHGMVVQAYLVEGRNLVRLYVEDGDPPAGFQPTPARLQDAYMIMMRAEDERHESAGLAA